MTIITKGKFRGEVIDFIPLSDIADLSSAFGNLDLTSDVSPQDIVGHAKQFTSIRIAFPTSHDGRGFSIARALRYAGYEGHLRAYGNVLADQYPLALNSGFDDVEISTEQAKRQPESQWLDAFSRHEHGYLPRLRTSGFLRHPSVKSAA